MVPTPTSTVHRTWKTGWVPSPQTTARGGDGRGRTELSYSLKEGTLALNEPPPGRVAVYYTVGGVPVGDASLGREALCGTTGGLLDPEAPAEDFDWGTNYLGMDMSRLRIDLESRRPSSSPSLQVLPPPRLSGLHGPGDT